MCYDSDLSYLEAGEVIGIKQNLWASAGLLHKSNSTCSKADIQPCLPEELHADRLPWDEVYDWFHSEECHKVDINKQTKREYHRKKFEFHGIHKNLVCEHRVCEGRAV